MTNLTPLTKERFVDLKASVCQPHLNQRGCDENGIHHDTYVRYQGIRWSTSYRLWLENQTTWMWRERQAIESYLRKYMRRCEETGAFFSGATDELGEKMYWRADGAADCLEHLLQEFGMEEANGRQ